MGSKTNTKTNKVSDQTTKQNTSNISYSERNPWDPAISGLETIAGDSGDIYNRAKGVSVLNPNTIAGLTGGAERANWANTTAGAPSYSGLKAVENLAAGGGGFNPAALGPAYKFEGLNLSNPTEVGSAVSSVAGPAPAYENIKLKSNIADLSSLIPDYASKFSSAVSGATAPIIENLNTVAIPALLSQQARTGGPSSRHAIQADNLASSFGRSIGDAISAKALDVGALESGDFRTLAGLGGADTTNLRALLGEDWRTLAGIGSDAYLQKNALDTQYKIAAEQAAAQQAGNRDSIIANAQRTDADRVLSAGMALPGIESGTYENFLNPSRTLTGIGEQQNALAQEDLWGALSKYMSVLQPLGMMGGSEGGFDMGTLDQIMHATENTDQTTTQSGGIGSVIKGLAGVASMLGGLGGFSGISGLLGSGAGAAAGTYGSYAPGYDSLRAARGW